MAAAAAAKAFITHASAARVSAFLACTGGGVGAQALLFGTPGASQALLGACVPYARAELRTFLDSERVAFDPDRGGYSSHDAAHALALAAYRRAQRVQAVEHHELDADVVAGVTGVGATASLRTAVPKRGPHQAFLCAIDACREMHIHIVLSKASDRSRETEERIVTLLELFLLLRIVLARPMADEAVADLLAELHSFGVRIVSDESSGPATDGVPEEDVARSRVVPRGHALDELEAGKCDTVLALPPTSACPSARWIPDARPAPGSVVLAGSFRPFHGGHERLAVAAARVAAADQAVTSGADTPSAAAAVPAAAPIVFELSIANADKGLLDRHEVLQRAAQFVGPCASVTEASPHHVTRLPPAVTGVSGQMWPLLITREPLFSGKARTCPHTYLVVGLDTVVRLVDPKYYEGGADDLSGVALALRSIEEQGCTLIVAGRPENAKDGTGRLVQLSDVAARVPAAFGMRLEDGTRVRPHLRPFLLAIPSGEFADSTSSTAIRARAAAAVTGSET